MTSAQGQVDEQRGFMPLKFSGVRDDLVTVPCKGTFELNTTSSPNCISHGSPHHSASH